MAGSIRPGRAFAAYGDRASANVRELQQLLRRMELYAGGITGHFDDATYQAYRQACDEAQQAVSRDKKGRLIVTLEDFETLEQRARGRRGYQKPIRTQVALEDNSAKRTMAAARQADVSEDDYAKRPVPPSEMEDNSTKRPVAIPVSKPVWRHWWAALLVILCIAIGVWAVCFGNRSAVNREITVAEHTVAPTVVAVKRDAGTVPDVFTPTPTSTLKPTAVPTAAPTVEQIIGVPSGDYCITVYNGLACSITKYSGNATKLDIPEVLSGYTVTAIGDKAFYDCDSLQVVSVPESVTSIGGSAFYDCDNLTKVTLRDGVVSIGYSAFAGCDSLTSVAFPDSVVSIGECAYSNCASLAIVTIPDSVTVIGNSAFAFCDSLQAVRVYLQSYAYDYCQANNLPYVLK